MNYLRLIVLITVGLALTHLADAFPKHGVRSEELPGASDEVNSLPLVNFKLNYRHYSGYLDSIEDIKLHYWFFESQNKPETDPVVLWLNGGPGCSSLLGAFTENGPLLLQPSGPITPNPYSWNRNASVLYLETPVYTGFSLPQGAGKLPPNNTDALTVAQNFAALKSFFRVKFPHLRSNPFYITGESYAGRYIPQLAVRLLKEQFPQNFKGVAIGNGYLTNDGKADLFAYYHGLTSSVHSTEQELSEVFHQGHISPYNILQNDSTKMDDRLAWYFNQAEVQKAIHVTLQSGQNWTECNVDRYDFPHDGSTMAPQLKTMVDSGQLKVVIYNGDLDSVCNFVGDKEFIEGLAYPLSTQRGVWFDYHRRAAGWSKAFADDRLVFTTVRGAGHMVPTDQPAAGLFILNGFLLGIDEPIKA